MTVLYVCNNRQAYIKVSDTKTPKQQEVERAAEPFTLTARLTIMSCGLPEKSPALLSSASFMACSPLMTTTGRAPMKRL